mmetsp:Transcript_52825/g.53227  ORF Transcript_52825/g.53227 Transcript_52825/m.53227 type:complete len:80 (+) Transcript_52825:601-840(+)
MQPMVRRFLQWVTKKNVGKWMVQLSGAVFCGIRRHGIGEKNYATKRIKKGIEICTAVDNCENRGARLDERCNLEAEIRS